jgi:predicted HTH transcriptional regulator
MRRLSICEERGSGIDKVVRSVEEFQLPGPDFRATQDHMVAVLYAHKSLRAMHRDDKIRACYQHAALRYVSNDVMTNSTLRARFGIEQHNYSIASRIIADTVEARLIRPYDPDSRSRKHARYVPFWA